MSNPELTERELDVLERAMKYGDTAAESSAVLFLAGSTIKNHRLNILRKLNAKTMPHAVYIYMTTKAGCEDATSDLPHEMSA